MDRAAGVLFGTTAAGSLACPPTIATRCGTVFALTPSSDGSAPWSETVIYAFRGFRDGFAPAGPLIRDGAGNLYGATYFRGNTGTVFKLSPPAEGQTEWTKTILHTFTRVSRFGDAVSGLAMAPDGTLYGTTPFSGPAGGSGSGTLFALQPPPAGTRRPGPTRW